MALKQDVDVGFVVHQAVHGYQDGHRLLESSLDLSSPDRRVLARQTDHPDAGRVKSWDALLVGYRLPSGMFSLSMTWPAWEMPRPGCVWTHSLLLDVAAMSRPNASELLLRFQRPEGPTPDLHAYRTTISLGARTLPSQPPESLRTWAPALFWALYEPPARPVRVTKVDLPDAARHRLLLDSWLLAWPTIRGEVTFCDAPKTARMIDDRPYQLQLHQTSRVEATSEDSRILRGVPDAAPPLWANRLVEESVRPTGLSEFVAAYGPSLPDDRGLMRLLVTVYLEHEHDSDPDRASRVVQSLSLALEAPSAGRSLKRDVLNPQVAPIGAPRALEEVGILRALVSTDRASAFNLSDLDIPSRARRLVRESPLEVQLVLSAIDSFEQPVAGAFISNVLDELDARTLTEWGRKDPEGLREVVRTHTALLFRPEVWSVLDASELWDVAVAQRKNEHRSRVLSAALRGGAHLDVHQVLGRWKNSGRLLLDLLVAKELSADKIEPFLRQMTDGFIAEHVLQLPVSDRLELIKSVEVLPTSVIADMSPDALADLVAGDASVAQFAGVLAAGLGCTDNPQWAEPSVTAYDRLAGPALRDELGEAKSRFDNVESSLPHWDVLARLAKAMNRALKGKAWPPSQALAIEDKAAFQALIEADQRASLARRMLLEAAQELVPVKSWQNTLLSKTIAERADHDALEKFIESVGKLGRVLRKLIP